MKPISIVMLIQLTIVGCRINPEPSHETLDNIFTSSYEHSIISKGDNLPNFDRRKDSLDLFLVALHEQIAPEIFQERVHWSDEHLNERILFLIDKGWLTDDDKGLRPTVFIATDQQGKELFQYGRSLAEKIALSIEETIPSIKEKFEAIGLTEDYDFDSMSFLILSNVLLDNWQIMQMEAAYLKKENRPERHGKFYYASIEENVISGIAPFVIYGNKYVKINDTTYLSIYGNNRIVVNERLRNDEGFKDSILNVALELTPALHIFFNEIAEDYRPVLLKLLDEQTDYSRQIYEETGYSNEIAYEEFFIWWYHFIYTDATNILAEKNLLTIPEEGNYYYK
jgi:hypothetical protein